MQTRNGDPRRAVDSNSRDKAASRGLKFQHREYAPCAFVCRRYFEYFLSSSVTKPLPVSRLPQCLLLLSFYRFWAKSCVSALNRLHGLCPHQTAS